MKLCCLMKQKKQECDKEFIVTNFDRFCKRASIIRNEACCMACQIGEEIAKESDSCISPHFADDSVNSLVSKCCERMKARMVSCPKGFHYNIQTNQCLDINECGIENNGCSENQVCENRVGSYACVPREICQIGFNFSIASLTCKKDCDDFVKDCEVFKPYEIFRYPSQTTFTSSNFPISSAYTKIDKCSKKPCSHGCKNVNGSFRCLCPKGFKLGPNKRSCEDVNECIEKQGACGKQICNNLIGSYACYERECPRGYKAYLRTSRNDFK
jgi:hypothetical protein